MTSVELNDLRIALAHDYLVQSGGAERVVATWAAYLTPTMIHTLSYAYGSTFPEIDNSRVSAIVGSDWLAVRVHLLLPILPALAHWVRVEDADVCLVSTSGWAHQFDFRIPTVTYVHSPARWLYAKDDYIKGLDPLARMGLRLSSPHLRFADRKAMSRMGTVIANSRTTQRRLENAFGIDSVVVWPPVMPVADRIDATLDLPEKFALVVARERGYKNLALAVEASRLANLDIVVVGAGSRSVHDPQRGVFGLGRITDERLKFAYGRAAVVVGAAHEDFGMTIPEANLEGTPAAAIPRGGYLETVENGANGFLASGEDARSLARAIAAAREVDASACRAYAQRFSVESHLGRLAVEMRRSIT